MAFMTTNIRYGLVVRISASHAEGRGSIPRVGTFGVCATNVLQWPMLSKETESSRISFCNLFAVLDFFSLSCFCWIGITCARAFVLSF